MRIYAPAKINLSLKVLGRRSDGYHDIRTLMAPLVLSDEIEIALEPGTGDPVAGMPGVWFECSDPSLPTDRSNLVLWAVEAFYGRGERPPVLRIRLTKRIPHGAGLGGGSSDAAAVLRALERMHGGDRPGPGSALSASVGHGDGSCSPELMAIAARIGSDVPFFLGGGAAWCEGRGERVMPCGFPFGLRLLLVKPPFGVPTPWAYGRWRESRELAGIPYGPQRLAWGELVNDLERPVFEKYLVLADLKRWLLARPEVEGALLAGSGATVFAVLSPEAADLGPLEEALKSEFGPTFWICRTAVRVPGDAG